MLAASVSLNPALRNVTEYIPLARTLMCLFVATNMKRSTAFPFPRGEFPHLSPRFVSLSRTVSVIPKQVSPRETDERSHFFLSAYPYLRLRKTHTRILLFGFFLAASFSLRSARSLSVPFSFDLPVSLTELHAQWRRFFCPSPGSLSAFARECMSAVQNKYSAINHFPNIPNYLCERWDCFARSDNFDAFAFCLDATLRNHCFSSFLARVFSLCIPLLHLRLIFIHYAVFITPRVFADLIKFLRAWFCCCWRMWL